MDEDECCVWVGNLSDYVNEELLYELFLQAGPVKNVIISRQPNGRQNSYGYVTFKHSSSVTYAVDLFCKTELYKRELLIKPRVKQMPDHDEPPMRGFAGVPVHYKESRSQQRFPGISDMTKNAVQSLRGFGADFGMRGRTDLTNPMYGTVSKFLPMDSVRPEHRPEMPAPNLNGFPDFNMLLQMGTQLLPNPYGSFPGMLSAQMDPHTSRHEDFGRSDHKSRSQNDEERRDFDRRNNYSSRDDRRNHPYRDHRRDDRNHRQDDRRTFHNNSRYRQSSSSHRRERR